MRFRTPTASAGVLLLFVTSFVEASHEHVHSHLELLHRRHRAHRALFSTAESGESGVELRSAPLEIASSQDASVERRGGQCRFPTNAGLVAVTPGSQNAGWAMSPNQPCLPGNYCPYACPPGQVSMQWDPSATSYTYPESMVSSKLAFSKRSVELTQSEWRSVLRRERRCQQAISKPAILPARHWCGHCVK